MLRLRRDVPLFPQGRKKAFTLSYDDGITQDIRFIQLLNKYRVKATFNLNSGNFGHKDHLVQPGLDVEHHKIEANRIKEIYRDHEIAVHSLTHPDLTGIPQNAAAYEVIEDRKNLERIIKAPVRGMAYPFGTYNERVVELLRISGIEYARTTAGTNIFELPENFLKWHPTCHHTDAMNGVNTDRFLNLFKKKEEYLSPQVFFVWGHTYEFDGRHQWQKIEEFLEKISGQEDIWYATNIEIADYINDFKQLRYSAEGNFIYNPARTTLWMNIDDMPYELKAGEITEVKMK